MNRRRLHALIPAALAALLYAPLAEAKQPAPHDTLHGFRPTGRLGVFRNGAEVPQSHVFYAQGARAWLVSMRGRQDALLLRLPAGKHALEAVPLEDLIPREDGSRDLKRSARIKSIGKFFRQGREIRLASDGLAGASLRPKPHLSGWKKARDLLDHKPEYGLDAVSIRSDSAKLQALKARTTCSIVVKVFFGSWCTQCDRLLPYTLHLDQALSSRRNIQFHYYAVPTKEGFPTDPQVVKNRIPKIPVGIVYLDGKEAGRIVQTDWRKPATALDIVVTSAEVARGGKTAKR